MRMVLDFQKTTLAFRPNIESVRSLDQQILREESKLPQEKQRNLAKYSDLLCIKYEARWPLNNINNPIKGIGNMLDNEIKLASSVAEKALLKNKSNYLSTEKNYVFGLNIFSFV